MRTRTLLIAGLVLVTASLFGPALQAGLDGQDDWWTGMHGQYGQTTWWSNDSSADNRIEGARELTLVASEFAFSPVELTADVGEAVNLTMVNSGVVPHDLAIPDLGIHVAAIPGNQATTAFIAETVGSFDVVCTYPGHADSGMTAVLIVSGDG